MKKSRSLSSMRLGTHERGSMAKHNKHRALLSETESLLQTKSGEEREVATGRSDRPQRAQRNPAAPYRAPNAGVPVPAGPVCQSRDRWDQAALLDCVRAARGGLGVLYRAGAGGEMTARMWTLQRGDVVTVRAKTKGKLWLDLRSLRTSWWQQ